MMKVVQPYLFRCMMLILNIWIIPLGYSQENEVKDSTIIHRIDSLLEKSKHLKPDSALSLTQIASTLAVDADLPHSQARAHFRRANILIRLGRLEKAKNISLANIPIFEAFSDSFSLSGSYNNLGVMYDALSQPDSSIHYHLQAIAIEELHKDTAAIITAKSGISNALTKKGKWKEALEWTLSAYQLSESVPDYPLGTIFGRIAKIMYEIRDYEQCLEYMKKSLEENSKGGHSAEVVTALVNISNVYNELGEADSAKHYLLLGLSAAERLNLKLHVTAICINLGVQMMDQDLPKQSIPYFERAWRIAQETQHFPQQLYIQKNLAKVHFSLQQFSLSYQAALKAKELAIQTNNQKKLFETYQLLANIAHELGKEAEAYKYLHLYTTFQDSANQVEVAEQIKSIEATFQDSLKTQQNALLTQENALLSQENEISQLKLRRRGLIIGGLIFITVLILAALWQFYRQKKQIEDAHRKLNEKQEALLVLEKDKSHLIRLLSHDLQAPLGYIRNILYFLGLQKLPENLLNLIHNGSKNATHIYTLSKEISETSQVVSSAEQDLLYETDPIDLHEHLSEVIQKYQPLASEKQIDIRLSMVSEDIFIQSNQLFLSHILGNLIQNAIKFSPEGKEVLVACKANGDDGQFVIEVTDQGPGIAEELQSYVFSSEKPPSMERDGSQGLYLSQQLAKAIHAKISYQTEVGKGSTFRLVGLA